MKRLLQLLRLGLALCALAALPWLGMPQPASAGGEGVKIKITQVDSSQFPKIKVYVSVTNAAGEPVAVAASQLQLMENGKPVTVESAGGNGRGEVGPLTTLLVVDVSGSMNEGNKLSAAKTAAQAYVDQMRPGDQAGLVAFNTQVTYLQRLTSDHTALGQAIDSLKAGNDTAMYDALAKGEEILASVPGRKAIIVLTDGLDNRSRYTADQVIKQIGPSGLSISTIGLGNPKQLGVSNAGLDEAALKSLAERAGGVYGYANDPAALTSLYQLYGRALQSEYVLTYTSAATLRDGVNRSLSVNLPEAGVQAQAAYNPGGLVPEVAKPGNAWLLFGSLLLVLLALLIAPMLIQRGLAAGSGLSGMWGKARELGMSKFGKKKKTSRIKLRDQAPPASQPRVRLH